jgi:hypothetical protein
MKTMQFSIDLIDNTLIYQRRHRLSKHEWELVDERCKKLHEAGLIQPSSFDFVTAIVMLAQRKIQLDYGLRKGCVGIISL